MSSSIILAARNFDVNEISKTVVSLLDNYNESVYTSVESADHCDDNGLRGCRSQKMKKNDCSATI